MAGNRVRSRADYLTYLGFLGIIGFISPSLKFLKLFFLFFLVPVILSLYDAVKRNDSTKNNSDYLRELIFGMILNPHLLFQTVLHSSCQTLTHLRLKIKGPSESEHGTKTEFSLPFSGIWYVENGGTDRKKSHSWDVLNQRYSYDFVIRDQDGRTYRGDGRKLEDFYAFGKPVHAPADGVVVQVRDDVPDNTAIGRIDYRAKDFRGNFVVIKHSESEYSFTAHLKYKSVRVRKGDEVKKGEIIGYCGNSGHSTEPHIHFHVQDRPNFYLAASLPIRFANICIIDSDKRVFVRQGYISRGQHVSNGTCG